MAGQHKNSYVMSIQPFTCFFGIEKLLRIIICSRYSGNIVLLSLGIIYRQWTYIRVCISGTFCTDWYILDYHLVKWIPLCIYVPLTVFIAKWPFARTFKLDALIVEALQDSGGCGASRALWKRDQISSDFSSLESVTRWILTEALLWSSIC